MKKESIIPRKTQAEGCLRSRGHSHWRGKGWSLPCSTSPLHYLPRNRKSTVRLKGRVNKICADLKTASNSENQGSVCPTGFQEWEPILGSEIAEGWS